MSWLGYRSIDDVLTFTASTHAASTGAATDADSVPSYRVYEDETGTAILSGSMAKLDDANTTGFYSEQITLSAANGFEAGKCYSIYISAAVSSVTGTTERHFSIWPASIGMRVDANVVQISGDSAAADNLEAYTDGTTPMPVNATQISGDSAAADNLEAAADGTGYNLGGGAVIAASVTGAVGSVTGNVGGNVTGSVGSVAAGGITAASIATDAIDADAIAADAVTEIQNGLSTLDAAGVRTAVGLASANLDTQLTAIDDFLDTEVAAIKAKTDNLPADPADASDIAASLTTIGGYIDTEVAAILAAVDTEVGAVKSVTDKLDTALELDGAEYRFTTNALEQAPAGGGGGGTDWTADERTAIRSILGVPASGTTPDAPSVGALSVIRDRIGAFTGTGVNTVLGFFKSLFRSDATLPSDIGGNYNPTLHSIEAAYDMNWAVQSASGMVTVTLDDNNNFTTVSEANQLGFMTTNGGTLKFRDVSGTTHTMTLVPNFVYRVKVDRFYQTDSTAGIVVKVFEV